VPGVFADQDGGPAPPRVERLHTPSSLDEPLLVEHAVGRQKDLAVDVAHPGVRAAERRVEGRVVEAVLVHLVEAEGDVHRRRLGIAVLAGQVVEQLVGADGEITHAAFEEVAGQRGLRRDDQLRRLGLSANLAEYGPEPAEVLA
jgi:hypothetical protein